MLAVLSVLGPIFKILNTFTHLTLMHFYHCILHVAATVLISTPISKQNIHCYSKRKMKIAPSTNNITTSSLVRPSV